MVGNLGRQSGCRWRARTAVRLAAPGKQASPYSLPDNRGQAVGFSTNSRGNNAAVLWQHGVMTNLNTLIPAHSHFVLLEALGINDRGQIAGYGQLPNGQRRGYLLTPSDTTTQRRAARPPQ
jgi:probable HAF family extracellular repeat protein